MSGIAKKMKGFTESSSMIRKMFEEGARMKKEFGAENVFDFSIGNPDVPPPPQFKTVLREMVQEETPGIHGYMPNAGFPFVRQALAQRIGEEQQTNIQADDIVMSCGAAGGLNVVFKALLDPGDEVVVFSPFFVEYHFYIDNFGGTVKIVPTDKDFNIDLQALKAALTPRTKVVLVNSPNNPTGQIYSAELLRQVGKIIDAAGKEFNSTIYLVSDEPYRNIVFDNNQVPPLMAASKNTIVVSSYSKVLSLPGERIGYIAVHPEMPDKGEVLGSLILATRILGFVNAPALMQRVVMHLQNVSADNAVYTRRLEAFCKVLDGAGFQYVRPKGAFYLFPQTPIADDMAFCQMLKNEKILAVPGRGFGLPGYIRLAFCVDEQVIARSADAFKRAVAQAKQATGN